MSISVPPCNGLIYALIFGVFFSIHSTNLITNFAH